MIIIKIENQVSYISRVPSAQCKQRDAAVQSKQMGARVNKQIQMDGRIIFDVLQLVLRVRFMDLHSKTPNSLRITSCEVTH